MADDRRVRWTPSAVTAAATVAAGLFGLSANVTSSIIPEDWTRQHASWVWGTTAFLAVVAAALGLAALRVKDVGGSGPVPSSNGKGPTVAPLPVWNVPPRNPHFTGRVEELARLQNDLMQHSTVTVHSLRGLGGIGKTQTAVEYAHRHAHDYDVVWWFNAERSAALVDQLVELGVALGTSLPEPKRLVDVIHRALRARGTWLLIFDNAESPDDVRPLVPSGPGRVLITTRREGFRSLGTVVDVDIFHREDSLVLLRRRAPGLTLPEAGRVAVRLGDLPLALEQAAAYLDQTGMTVDQYLHLLDTRASDLHSRGRPAGHSATIATVWSLSLDRLRAASPPAVQIMRIAAWLAPEPIPPDLFTGCPDLLPEPLRAVAADPIAFADAMGSLADASLVRRTAAGLVVHRLVQDVARNQDGDPTASHPLLISLLLLLDALPDDARFVPVHWPRYRQLLPHVVAATARLQDDVLEASAPSTREAVALLLHRTGRFLIRHGRTREGLPMIDRALRISEALHGPHHPHVARELDQYGRALSDLGRLTDALPRHERALRIYESELPAGDPRIAYALLLLGGTLTALGRPGTALPMLERAARIDEQAYGPDHPYVARDLVSWGRVLSRLGRHEDALPMVERALRIDEATYGSDHPYVAADAAQLGSALSSAGRAAEALTWVERALHIHQAAYGADNPSVGSDLSQFGQALLDLERPEEALPLLERALHIHQTALVTHHPEVGEDLSRLGTALIRLGREDEARPRLEQALEICRATLGPEHPDVERAQRQLAALT
jgi:tetratricopeptide (TPR) repeat protein